MNFSVCLKQVPDVAAPTRLDDGALVQDSDRMVLNAYDASALEAALVLRETHGGSITVVLVGPERAAETLRKGLAMGADEAVHIVADDTDYDSRVYADLLAAYFRSPDAADADVIACGKQAQDTDAGLAGGMLAALLDRPYAANAVGLTLEAPGGPLVVTRQGDAGQEIVALPLPCLVTCSNDMNDPRIPNLRGIMQAKRKPIHTRTPADLDITDLDARTRVVGYERPPERPAARMLDGEPADMAAALTDALRTEARVL